MLAAFALLYFLVGPVNWVFGGGPSPVITVFLASYLFVVSDAWWRVGERGFSIM